MGAADVTTRFVVVAQKSSIREWESPVLLLRRRFFLQRSKEPAYSDVLIRWYSFRGLFNKTTNKVC